MRTFSLSFVAALISIGCAGSAPAPVPSDPDTCPESGWCWERGRPLVVDGDRARGEVLAFGAEGSLLRWNADRWDTLRVPTEHWIVSAWSASPSEVWASDDAGSAWHWDGAAWNETPADAPIARVLGAPDRAAWAIAGGGDGGHGELTGTHLIRRDADRWVTPFDPFAYCVGGDFAIAPDGAPWSAGLVCDATGAAVGMEVHRWSGAGWERVGDRIAGQGWYPRLAVVGDRVVVEATGRFVWDGASWVDATRPAYPQDLAADETALWDGLGWTRAPITLGCEGTFRLDDAHAWCFGEGRIAFAGSDARWTPTIADRFERTSDASAWSTLAPVVWAGGDTVLAWGASASDAYRVRASTGARLEHFDAETWTIVLDAVVRDLDADARGEVWLATDAGVMHGAGSSWTTEPLPAGASEVLHVDALEEGRALAVTRESLFAFASGAWTDLYDAPRGYELSDAAGTSLGDVWVVQPNAGRSNEVLVLHTVRGAFATVEVPGVSGFGVLTATGAGTWLASDGLVARLDDGSPPIAMPTRLFDVAIWASRDAVWLTSASQALRHPL